MGWLWLVGSLKWQVSFAEYSLFYRALLQKRPINLRSLSIEATPYVYSDVSLHTYTYVCVRESRCVVISHCTPIHIYKYVRIYFCGDVSLHTHIPNVWVCESTCVVMSHCMRIYMCVHVSLHTHIPTCVCENLCTHIYIYVCLRISCMCRWDIKFRIHCNETSLPLCVTPPQQPHTHTQSPNSHIYIHNHTCIHNLA